MATIYEPLPEGEYIRLLILHSKGYRDKIKCSLETIPIASAKNTYHAISYVWGDPKNTVNITCNGLQVPITVSLADALRTFRPQKKTRKPWANVLRPFRQQKEAIKLWADALCINQKDDKEKGHQVKRMGQIYANAKSVFVWLGRDPDQVAKDTFDLICGTNKYFGELLLKNNNRYSKMPPLTEPYPICVDESRWSGVAMFFDFPWFKRVWTVQEVAIAKTCRMFWSSSSIDVADVFELCVWYHNYYSFTKIMKSFGYTIQFPRSRLVATYHHYDSRQVGTWQQSRPGLRNENTRLRGKSFLRVLEAARGLQASDSRDYVYAFLGCPYAKDNQNRMLIEADYTVSLDNLSFRLACSLLQDPREASWALSSVKHKKRSCIIKNTSPSWVPQWHKNRRLGIPVASARCWYRAGGRDELFSATILESRRLRVGGVGFDKIVWVSDIILSNNFKSESSYWDSEVRASNELYIDTVWREVSRNATELGIRLQETDYARTLMRGYPGDTSRNAIGNEANNDLMELYKRALSSKNFEDFRQHRATLYVEDGLYSLSHSRLFLTKHGRLGLAPEGRLIEVGDVCCIIFGSTVPFLLTPEQDGRHKLISDCYIHGVMDGELMEQFEKNDFHNKHIILE
jgi:hypothetical protein